MRQIVCVCLLYKETESDLSCLCLNICVNSQNLKFLKNEIYNVEVELDFTFPP